MPSRLVLDTNIVVSALLFSGRRMSWVSDGCESGVIVPLASSETVAELAGVLSYPKFGLTETERDDLLGHYLTWCDPVVVAVSPSVPPCRDPRDRPFLELAVAGGADALVTGDRDLLVLASRFPIPILTAAEVLERFGG